MRTCSADDKISKFEIAGVKNADKLSYSALKTMAKIIPGLSKQPLTIIQLMQVR